MSDKIDTLLEYAEYCAQRDDRIDVFEATRLDDDHDDEHRIHIEACEIPGYLWTLFAKPDVAFGQFQSSDTVELTFTYNKE